MSIDPAFPTFAAHQTVRLCRADGGEPRLTIRELDVEGAAALTASQAVDPEQSVRSMLELGGTLFLNRSLTAPVELVGAQIERLAETVRTSADKAIPEALDAFETRLATRLARLVGADGDEGVLTQHVRTAVRDGHAELSQSLLASNGPLARLAEEIDQTREQVARLDERLAADRTLAAHAEVASVALAEAERAGHRKGLVFETNIGSSLHAAWAPMEAIVEETGTTAGATGAKKGDHTAELPARFAICGQAVRIVHECKDQKISANTATRELDEAMTNRASHAGVLICRTADQLPGQMPLRVLPSRGHVWVAYDPGEGGEGLLPIALQIAAALATSRLHVELRSTSDTQVDLEAALRAVERLGEIAEQACAIARNSAAARKAIDAIDRSYDVMQRDTARTVDGLRDLLVA